MANMQHPIIKPLVFGKQIQQPIIQLTTGWLLGSIQYFDKRVNTPLSGYGHYPMTYEVVSLFISAWRNTEGDFIDNPRYLPQNHQRGGHDGCTPSLVEWHLWWLAVGPYDPQGQVALCHQPDQDQQSISPVIAPNGVLNWKAPNDCLHQATQAIQHGTTIVLHFLPRIMKLESLEVTTFYWVKYDNIVFLCLKFIMTTW